ncbi:MAG: polymer-forming cytoskeletal protein [Polyangiaceae bacterium]|jgi:cytoskeletal protein CcmA (bactofilin family)|nr:polymer-forming cytoskeletal protein [Polyangiaceae bacterium]
MASTHIAQGITVEGDLTSDEDVEIAGTLRGSVATKESLSVAAGAVVDAQVSAASVFVAGTINGDVVASERVDLQAGARLVGDVKSARLTIADGASFKGNVDMDVDP